MRTLLVLASILAGCDREQHEVSRVLDEHRRASDEDGVVARWAREDQASCDAWITPVLRDRYLRGLVPSVAPRAIANVVDCRFAPPGDDPATLLIRSHGVSVAIECSSEATDPDRIAYATATYHRTEAPLAGVGRAAIASRFRVMFWATKADCNATIDWYLGPDQLVPFARELDGVLGATSGSGSGE